MRFKLMVGMASMGLAFMPVALAQSSSQQGSSGNAYDQQNSAAGNQETSGQYNNESSTQNQFYHTKQIIGAQANNSAGQKLGEVHDVVFNPQDGEIFAAVGVGNGKYALVPWQALTVTMSDKRGWWWLGGNQEKVTINTSKQSLDSAPSISGKQSQRLSDPGFTQSIYSYFNVQAPNRAMGGTGEGSSGGESQGMGGSSTNNLPGNNEPSAGQSNP